MKTRQTTKAFDDLVYNRGRKLLTNVLKIVAGNAAMPAYNAMFGNRKSYGGDGPSARLSGSSSNSTNPRKERAKKMKYKRVKKQGASNEITTSSRPNNKRKRAVTVSKKFKAKVRKVITKDAFKGKTMEIGYGCLRWIDSEDNKQIVVDITQYKGTSSTFPDFSHLKILDAASVLWNEKAQTADKSILIGNFDRQKIKIKVINSSVTYHFRNNTKRDCNMKLLEISPKNSNVEFNPLDSWAAALSQTNSDEGPNQNNSLITQLYSHPASLHSFRKQWNTKTTTICIPPGGKHTHVVLGPKDKMFDFSKFWNGTTFKPYNTDCKWLIAIYYPDLVTTTLSASGRYCAAQTETPDFGIAFETITNYLLEMPEQAGFIYDGGIAGDVQTLSQRQWSFSYNTYGEVQAGQTIRVDDENPADTETDI